MTLYNYVADKEGLEELVVAAIVTEVRLPEPTDDWQQDAHAIASAMWQGVRAHPAAIPLVLTRRMSSATGFAAADALVGRSAAPALPTRTGCPHSTPSSAWSPARHRPNWPARCGRAAEAAERIGAVAGAELPAHRGAVEGRGGDIGRGRLRRRACACCSTASRCAPGRGGGADR